MPDPPEVARTGRALGALMMNDASPPVTGHLQGLPPDHPATPFAGESTALGYRPVEPKPPAPRTASGRTSTGRHCTWPTARITSWAMRSPRQIS